MSQQEKSAPERVNKSYKIRGAYVMMKKGEVDENYKFKRVFPEEASQADLFKHFESTIKMIFEGENICLFTYGQTGSGKTYTLQGTLYKGKE
jgi:DNA replication protein DnaC